MERQRENFLMTRKVNHSVTVGLAALALCSVSTNLMAAVNNPKIAREVILPQNESLFGYVYDQDKNPLPGVTVKVEGTQIVTVTDDEGRYSFSQPVKRGANVKFSMLGFKTKRVVYKGQSAISPMLEPSATSVGEVVVVARSNINAIDLRAKSGVVENVDMKRVEAKPMIDMALALQGAVLGYSLLSTYDLYATYKADASSVLPSDKRWNKAWAVGLGWTPSNYAFLKDNKVISRLNFKGSYGITANLNGVSVSTTTGTFSYSTNTYEDQRVLELISLYNKDLKPEQNKSVDLGMSMDLFNRITLDVNYYNRRTEQALLDVPIPTSVGYSTLKRNIGVLENRGIELGLSAKIIDTYDCRLSIGANLAYNDNKVLDLYYADKIYTTEDALVPDYEVGKSYDMLYGPTSLGINPLTGYPVFLLPDGTEKQATEALTKDDVVALGHLTPPYSGTFNLSFSYKSFDFDMDFYYVHGGIQRFNYSYVRDKDNVNKNAVAGQTEKMWFKQGDENKTYWTPFYTSSTAEDNIALYPNSRTVGKSDYLRLSMVSMRYRLPAATLHKILPFMQYATVGFQASNLFTWTSYKESAPESGTLAGTTQPIYTFNLNLTF